MNTKQVSFTKTSRDWLLASNLYDSVVDVDISHTLMLLETKKANPNVLLPEYGVSPFHLVIGSEDRKFAYRATKAYLLHGADPNIRSDDGVTPVHIAAMWGHTDVLDLLLSAGGNPWLIDCDGKNAFQYAEEEKNWQAYNLLYNNDTENFNSTLCDVPVCRLEQSKVGKREVVLYRDDLHVEYEAVPLKHSYSFHHCLPQHKSASTQTPISQCSRIKDFKKCSRCDLSVQRDDKKHFTEASCKGNLDVQFDWCRKDKNFCLYNDTLKTILNHRKKTTIYEYRPKKDSQDYTFEMPEVTSTKFCPQRIRENRQNLKVNLLSDFKNKVKQIRKHNQNGCGKGEKWQNNIFNILALSEKEGNNASTLHHESGIQNHINQNKIILETKCTETNQVYDQTIKKEIGCIKSESCDLHKQLQSSVHDHEASNCQQTSIFSDIDSDISVCVISGVLQPGKTISNMLLTDDELSMSEEITPGKLSVNKCSLYNENIMSSNASMSTALCTPDSEISENKDLCSAKMEILQSAGIQNSMCDLEVDTNETAAVINCEGHDEQLTSCSHKWVEADVFSSDDEDKELSILEEYLYTDDEEGIILSEKRYLSNGVNIPVLNSRRAEDDCCSIEDCCYLTATDTSSVSAYDTDTLRRKLSMYGFCPGPITGHTKHVYLRKLEQLHCDPSPLLEQSKPEYSPELQRVLALPNMYLLKQWAQLEQEMCYEFSVSSCNMSWREGVAKTSFTYLLLDPRITCNLPATASNFQLNQIWEKFLEAIFYVGKGKRSRPYSHLYQSVAIWKKRQSENSFSKKVERILEIWHSGQGVVCLHVFQNIMPVEAYTREAAMISALTLGRLTNEKSGEFYGPSANWLLRQKRQLGAVLLYRACQVFMGEGERQIRPTDID